MLKPAGVALLALGVAACGGKDLSREEFMARANRECRQAAHQVSQVPDLRRLDLATLAGLAERAKARASRTQEGLKQATPTRDAAAEYGELVIHVADVVEQLEEVKDAARAGSRRRVDRHLEQIRHSAHKAGNVAGRLGLDWCAQAAARVAQKARGGLRSG